MAHHSEKKSRILRIAKVLEDWFPNDTKTALNFRNPFELLVATILAAQCTDERVNQVTPNLFERYPDAQRLAKAEQRDVEEIIKSTGFYRAKAKNLIACAKKLVEAFGGEVPQEMEALTTLPGVGRKTANVVRTNCFGLPGIVVDTHVLRVTQRLGLAKSKDADQVEAELMELLPEAEWSNFSHRLTWLGRKVCYARKPACAQCRLLSDCPSGLSEAR